MGPLEMVKPWNTKGVEGVFRFLNRVWNMMVDEDGNLHASVDDCAMTREQERILHYSDKEDRRRHRWAAVQYGDIANDDICQRVFFRQPETP